MAIKKAVFEYVVLFDDSIESPDWVAEASASTIEQETYDGSMIGLWSLKSMDDVPTVKVEEELVAIGNDGTFFYPA